MTLAQIRPGLFTEAGRAGDTVRLLASRCAECSCVQFPAAGICPVCGGPAAVEELPADAELVGFSSVEHAPPGAQVEVPYTVGVAQFGADVCVMGLVEATERELDFGQAVRTVAFLVGDDHLSYAFRVV